MPTPQHTSTTKNKNTKIFTIPQLPSCEERCKHGTPIWKQASHWLSTNNHPTQLHAANEIDCCFMAILSWWKPAGQRIMRKPWSNLMSGLSMNLREQIAEPLEQTADKREKYRRHFARARGWNPAEDGGGAGFDRGRYRSNGGTSRFWRSPIRESHGTPKHWSMVATNRSIMALSYPHDHSWGTVQELSFKNIEEAKMQMLKKNDGGRSYANLQTSSWSWHQPMTWTSSSWQLWSSNETRERSDWKTSSDWSSSDSTRERAKCRSSSSWQSPFS